MRKWPAADRAKPSPRPPPQLHQDAVLRPEGEPLIDNDRQLEGCFTSFHSALSRSALKKERFLNGKPESPRVQAQAAAQPDTPAVAPALAAQPLFAPRPESPFADKLKQALQPAGPKQDS